MSKKKSSNPNKIVSRNSTIKKQDLDKVMEILTRIMKRDGGITPGAVVKEAKKNKVLHQYFEWDDVKAAAEYRLWQARHIIASIDIVIESREPTRAFIQVITEDRRSVYLNQGAVLRDVDLKQQYLEDMFAEYESWKTRYNDVLKNEPLLVAVSDSTMIRHGFKPSEVVLSAIRRKKILKSIPEVKRTSHMRKSV